MSKGNIRLRTAVSVAALLVAAPAWAQAADVSGPQQAADAQGAGKGVADIVVTATRRSERLQDVPVSVTAVTKDVLERQNVRDINDLTKIVPGLTITYGSQPGNFSINMRGIGTLSNGIAVESDVAVVIDDVPVGFQAAAFKDFLSDSAGDALIPREERAVPATLDAIDRKILKELQDDGRMTNVELARRVGISAPPCLRRVRALEEAGYIKGYRALLDEKLLGYEVVVFAFVHLSSQAEADLSAFEAFVRAQPLVRECWMLSGEIDFVLKCVAPDLKTFQTFVEKLTSGPNVKNVKTSLTLRQSKDAAMVPM